MMRQCSKKKMEKGTDSGVLSDVDYNKSTTMSSCESDNRTASLSSATRSFSDSLQSSGSKDYSTGSSSHSVHLSQSQDFDSRLVSSDITLPELTQVPWTESDLLLTLEKGKLKQCCGNISIECLQRLSYLLQRPLIRIAREAGRLCSLYNKCSKHDIQTACKVVLSPTLYTLSNNFASQAMILHTMSAKNNNRGKSSLSDLSLSVGKHHRWLFEALPAGYVHELSAVYLTAVIETLIEQTVLLALPREHLNKMVITTDMLESGIRQCASLNSLYNPSSHLLSSFDQKDISYQYCPRTITGKTLESNLQASCVSSISELTDIVSMAMHHWYPRLGGNNQSLIWSAPAIQSLLYYMKCSQGECSLNARPSLVSLTCDRPHLAAPPIADWLRIAAAFAEHRMHRVIDGDDVRQAARLLLPGMDCPIRSARCAESVSALVDQNDAVHDILIEFALTLLSSGNPSLMKHASGLLSQSDLNKSNHQGLTALMEASGRGDDLTVLTLLRLGATPDITVAPNHPSCAGWTALSFAVSNNHYSVVKALLEAGCSVEAGANLVECETPLQLASAAGHIEMVTLLLQHGADPHRITYFNSGSEARNRFTAYSLAASHGRRDVMRRLFAETLKLHGSRLLTLREMLSESCEQQKNSCTDRLEKECQQVEQEPENEYMVIENDYVTIEELRNSEYRQTQLRARLSPCHIRSLQDSLYNAVESGFLDLTLEIQSTGVMWTLHTWYMTLQTAHIMQRKAIVQSMLRDFTSIDYKEDLAYFSTHSLPLMFDIFRESKNEMISQQLARIFSQLYGSQPLPLLKDLRSHPKPLIDSHYVNSRELADISFIVEQKTFYAHKIILASASQRFKSMLTNFTHVTMPEIEIRDIDYQTFESVMRYVYEGNAALKSSEYKSAKNLLGAAHYFQLEGLKRKCEIFLSKNLSVENCVSVYKAAKIYSCDDLLEFCEAFFLQNLSKLLTKSDTFKRVLYSTKVHNRELLNRLSNALLLRLNSKSSRLSSSSSLSS